MNSKEEDLRHIDELEKQYESALSVRKELLEELEKLLGSGNNSSLYEFPKVKKLEKYDPISENDEDPPSCYDDEMIVDDQEQNNTNKEMNPLVSLKINTNQTHENRMSLNKKLLKPPTFNLDRDHNEDIKRNLINNKIFRINKKEETHNLNHIFSLIVGAKKTVTTNDWRVALEEVRFLKLLGYISSIRKHKLHNFDNSPEKNCSLASKSSLPLHWDFVIEEALWLETDFQLERRWKLTASYLLSCAVMQWHNEKNSKLNFPLKIVLDETSNVFTYPQESLLPVYIPLIGPNNYDDQINKLFLYPKLKQYKNIIIIPPITPINNLRNQTFFLNKNTQSNNGNLNPNTICLETICWHSLNSTLSSLISEFSYNWDVISVLLAPKYSKGFFKNYYAYYSKSFTLSCYNYSIKSSLKGSLKKDSVGDDIDNLNSSMERLYNLFCVISTIVESKKRTNSLNKDPLSEFKPECSIIQNIVGCFSPQSNNVRRPRSSLNLIISRKPDIIHPDKLDILPMQNHIDNYPNQSQPSLPRFSSNVLTPTPPLEINFTNYQSNNPPLIYPINYINQPLQSVSPNFHHLHKVHMGQQLFHTNTIHQDIPTHIYKTKFYYILPPTTQQSHIYNFNQNSFPQNTQNYDYRLVPPPLIYHPNLQSPLFPNPSNVPQGLVVPPRSYISSSPNHNQFILMYNNEQQHIPSSCPQSNNGSNPNYYTQHNNYQN